MTLEEYIDINFKYSEGRLYKNGNEISAIEVRLYPEGKSIKRASAHICYYLLHGRLPKKLTYNDGNKYNWSSDNLTDVHLTYEEMEQQLKAYTTKKELNETNHKLYVQLLKRFTKQEQQELTKHMTRITTAPKYTYSYEDCLGFTTMCSTWAEFMDIYRHVYDFARSQGYLQQLKKESGLLIRYVPTEEDVLADARSYNSLSEMPSYLINRIYRLNISHKLHFPLQTKYTTGLWDYETCKHIVSTCDNRNDLLIKYPGAHSRIYKEGWLNLLEELPTEKLINVLYLWKVEGLSDVYKIGVSNNNAKHGKIKVRWLQRIADVCTKGNITASDIHYLVTADAQFLEKRLLSSYPVVSFDNKFTGSSEFRQISDATRLIKELEMLPASADATNPV